MESIVDKKLIYFTCALAVVCLVPELGFAEGPGKDLLEGQLDKEVSNLVGTLFGYPTKIAGILACAYGVLQTYLSSSPKPIMMWGGVALLSFFMPKILSTLFQLS